MNKEGLCAYEFDPEETLRESEEEEVRFQGLVRSGEINKMICANGYAENCLLRALHLNDKTAFSNCFSFSPRSRFLYDTSSKWRREIRSLTSFKSRCPARGGELHPKRRKGRSEMELPEKGQDTWFSSATTAGRGITVRRKHKLGEATTRVDRRHKKNRWKSLGTSLWWNLPRKMNQRSRLDTKRPMKTLLTTSRSRPTATTRNTRLSNNRMAARRANRWTHRPATNR